jgi:phenylacetate-CoA ligase
MNPAISQRILFSLHRLIGSDLQGHYREFIRLSQGSPAEIAKIRDERLERLLNYAARRVPYYRERVSPGDGLDRFPILSKNDLHISFQQLKSPGLFSDSRHRTSGRGYSWTEVRSGGTTGAPVRVIHDREFRDRGRASRLFSKYLCGFPYGTPHYYLWGSVPELKHQAEGPMKRLDQALAGTVPINAFRMNEEHMRLSLQQMISHPLPHLMTYVDAAERLVQCARLHGLPMPRFHSIMACAGTVFEGNRRLLTDAFGGKVHNKYGSRECTDMVCENSSGELLIFANHVLLEVVDDSGRAVAEGQSGRILVTLLGNHSFPLIRYEIGDMAIQGRPHGHTSPFPTLYGIEGRISDFITSTRGDYVSPLTIRHLVGVVHAQSGMERYQFIQYPGGRYELKVQLDPVISGTALEALKRGVVKDLVPLLGPGAEFKVQRADNIQEGSSGKFRYVINCDQPQK